MFDRNLFRFRNLKRLALAVTGCLVLCQPMLTQKILRLADDHRYDVDSIKPADPQETGFMMNVNAAGTEMVNRPLTALFLQAYGLVSNSQIEGLPPWATDRRFDVKAQTDAVYCVELSKLDPQVRWDRLAQMNQRLLQERFGLQAHIEVRHRRQLQLVRRTPDRTGELLKRIDDGSTPELSATLGRYKAHAIDLATLCSVLSRIPELDQPVVDATAIPGRFDFQLRWQPADRRASDEAVDVDPPLSKALEEQLGLTLQRKLGDSDVLVIDHLSPPEPN